MRLTTSSKTTQKIDLVIIIKGFDNSPRPARKCSVEDIFIKDKKNESLQCQTFEDIDSAFRIAERYAKNFPDSFAVTIDGKINQEKIKEEFDTLSGFKNYLIKQKFPVQTEDELIESLMPSPR